MQINADTLQYIPIPQDTAEMSAYATGDFLKMVLETYSSYYPKVGCNPPWLGYVALNGEIPVGVGGFKGGPVGGQVEIGYGTVPEFEGCGVSSATCRFLTDLALSKDPTLRVTARTLQEESASTRILRKNGFHFAGIVDDPEDGEVWEWEYRGERV